MHRVFEKHANDEDTYASDFTARLGVGETISSVLAFVVTQGRGKRFDTRVNRRVVIGPWTVVTSEFISGSATISGSVVFATFKKRAAAGEQKAGSYVVRVEVQTSAGRKLVDVWELELLDTALP